jgi:ribonuclease Z
MKISRRKFMQAVGVSAAAAGAASYLDKPLSISAAPAPETRSSSACYPDDKTSLFDSLPTCCPGEPLAADEVRVTFLGTSCLPRLSQQGVSVYVEFGPTTPDPVTGALIPRDYLMFDCGMGILANYIAMGIPYSRLNKIFIAHLHADHMSDLSAIYCFGEASDRKSPLYVWGPSPSGWPDPVTGQLYDDGVRGTLEHFREVWRWHSESFSFSSNSMNTFVPPTRASWGTPCDLVPVGPVYRTNRQGKQLGRRYADPYGMTPDGAGNTVPTYDAYALVPIELDWHKSGKRLGDNIAYHNRETGVKVTHFPAIHTRRGAISYKLEWQPPDQPGVYFSMIYSGDTKPNNTMLKQAENVDPVTKVARGIDLWVHEIVMPPDQWAAHDTNTSVCSITEGTKNYFATVENSSHTTQAAFGYLLGQIKPAPRLAIATHFQAQDSTIYGASDPSMPGFPEVGAKQTVDNYLVQAYPGTAPEDLPKYTFAADFMVFNVRPGQPILQRRADVSRFAFCGIGAAMPASVLNTPKYWKYDQNGNKVSDPEAQIDTSDQVPSGGSTYADNGYFPGEEEWTESQCPAS